MHHIHAGAGTRCAPETTFGFSALDSAVLEDLELTQVASHGWRVSDGRLPPGDPLRLLAFVEQRGEVFEVMQLGSGFQWHEFGSMPAAIEFVVRSAPLLVEDRMHGDLAWVR